MGLVGAFSNDCQETQLVDQATSAALSIIPRDAKILLVLAHNQAAHPIVSPSNLEATAALAETRRGSFPITSQKVWKTQLNSAVDLLAIGFKVPNRSACIDSTKPVGLARGV